jgi:hypothetical protein
MPGVLLLLLLVVCCCLQRARRTKRSFFPWLITLALVACAWFKLVTLSSTLNKMAWQGTWCATNDNLDIKYTFNPNSAVRFFLQHVVLLLLFSLQRGRGMLLNLGYVQMSRGGGGGRHRLATRNSAVHF